MIFIKKILISFLTLFLVFFSAITCVSADTIEKDGWEIDVSWQDWLPVEITATYTITDDDIGEDRLINIDCNPVAMFLAYGASSYGLNGAGYYNLNLTIKNESSRRITFNDYSFGTYSYEGWGEVSDMENLEIISIGSNYNTIGMGKLMQDYFPFLNEEDFDITAGETGVVATISTIGFDGKNIRAGFLANRTQSLALENLLGSGNLTVTKISNVDSIVKGELTFNDYNGKSVHLDADENRTYADYVKKFYGVSSLDELTDLQLNEFFDSEDQIRGYDNESLAGLGKNSKYLLFNEINDYVNDNFKYYGIAGASRYNNKYVFASYFMREQDPEIQALAYKYIFKNVIRFTFDSKKYPISGDIGISPVAGNMGLLSYIEKDDTTTEMVNDVFSSDEYLESGESFNLPNVSSTMISVDAFDVYNMFDFGFSIQYEAEAIKKNVILTKKDSNTKLGLSGAVYKLQTRSASNEWVDVENYDNLVTDDDGNIEIESLEEGEYRLVETEAPNLYEVNDDYVEFTIDQTIEDDNVYLVSENSKIKSNLIVHYYLDGTTTKIENDDELVGLIGDAYETSKKELEKYDFVSSTDNTTGKYQEEDTEVIYYYSLKEPIADGTVKKISVDTITKMNEPITYTILYSATVKDFSGTVKVEIVDELPYEIDVEASDLAGGVYDDKNKTITWYEEIEITEFSASNKVELEKSISLLYKDVDYTKEIENNAKVKLTAGTVSKESTVTRTIVPKIPAKIIVNHYDKKTNEQLAESTIKEVILGESYETSSSKEVISKGYRVSSTVGETKGVITEPEIVVNYYYESNPYTGDNVLYSFAIFGLTGLIIIILIVFLMRQKKNKK